KSVSQLLENSPWAKTALYCTTALLVFSSGPGVGALWAQGQGQEIKLPASLPNGGLQILNISGYTAYYSSGLPSTGGFQAGAANFPSDVAAGGSTTIGWAKSGESSTFSLTYTPSYTGRVRYSSANALNHAFSLNTTRKLAPRWTFSFSVRADYSSFEQAVF